MKKYMLAIVAGVACGIILAILSFFGIVVFKLIFPWEMTTLLFGVIHGLIFKTLSETQIGDILLPCVVAFSLVGMGAFTFFIAGSFALKLASRYITNIFDVVVLGVIAGLTAEIILLPLAIFLELLSMIIINPDSILASYYYGIEIWKIFIVITLVFGIIFAVMGAFIYYAIAKKKDIFRQISDRSMSN